MPLNAQSQALVDAMSDAMPWGSGDPVAFRDTLEANRMPPSPLDDVEMVDVDADGVPVRIYYPQGAARPLPVMVYYHGGGFVAGSIATFDRLCQRLTRLSGCAVASVEYRLAPEHPYPAAVEDAIAAMRWVAAKGGDHGLDTQRMALGGDSAGGNLAIVTALALRDAGGPPLAHLLLIYPGVDLVSERPSHAEFAEGYLLDSTFAEMCIGAYVPDPATRAEVQASPLHAESFAGLPPVTVVIAECDPSRDDSLAFVERLQADNVPVTAHVYDGAFHGFFSMFEMLPQADEAVETASRALADALR